MHAWMVMKLFRPIRPIADDFDQEVEAPRRLNSYDGLNNPPPLNSSVTLRLSDYGLVERYFKGSILRPAWGMGSATLQNERQLQNPSFFLPGGKNVCLRGHSRNVVWFCPASFVGLPASIKVFPIRKTQFNSVLRPIFIGCAIGGHQPHCWGRLSHGPCWILMKSSSKPHAFAFHLMALSPRPDVER